jgi:hypothetical protein
VLLGYPPAGGALTIINNSGVNGPGPAPGTTVYLGTASSVSSTTGFPLPPGSVYAGYGFAQLATIPPIYAITATASGGAFTSANVTVNATVN